MTMLTLSNGIQIQISSKLLGRGGEGEVFEILQPHSYSLNVAKIFYNDKRTPEREQKLRHLINNPPQIEENGHIFLIWPLELLYEKGQFVGFIMPRAEGIELELLCDDDFLNYPEYKNSIWEKFSFSQANSNITRLKIAHNICAAVASVHAKRDYVLADLKPVNIKISDRGLICIIDLDSIQVTENNKVLFASKVATAEYSPPEVGIGPTIKNEFWDRFSLAVIVYRILVGIHPFSGSLKPPYDKLTVYEDLIKEGFYPHGKRKGQFSIINPTHNLIFKYPDSVIEISERAFDRFLFKPDQRPSAIEWCNALTAKPEIISFNANKTFVLPNASVQLNWFVKNAISVEIDNGIGIVTGNSLNWPISKPVHFVMKATNPFGDVYSKSISVATLNLKVPTSIFIPTPQFNIHTNLPVIKSISQIPSPNFPIFTTPDINVDRNISKKIKGNFSLNIASKKNLLKQLKDNYEWTKSLLENNNYQISFDEYIKYRIYVYALQLRDFFYNLKVKHTK